MPEGVAAGDTAEGSASARAAEDRAAEDAVVDAWRGLLVAHSRLVPAVEADLRAAGQVPLSWYDVLLELNAAPRRRLRMSDLGERAVLSRTRVSRVVDELAGRPQVGLDRRHQPAVRHQQAAPRVDHGILGGTILGGTGGCGAFRRVAGCDSFRHGR